ncbi:hypothetical protein [Nonomuraea sp. B5E05]|uniref:hypothetical protein n=1 Tax=Nonomuraea sp. B5E05 TaxID=3153569 RepID=UPI00326041F9
MAWKQLPDQDKADVKFELRRLAERVADLVTTATPAQPYDGPPEQRTAGQLALIHAATLLKTMADDLADQAAHEAGQLGLAGFPQLGEAAGITRQSARERWRHLIPEQHRRRGRRPAPPPAKNLSAKNLPAESPAGESPAEPAGAPELNGLPDGPPDAGAPSSAPASRPATESTTEAPTEPRPATVPSTPRQPARSRNPVRDVPSGRPWTTETDPMKRRRWFTDEELDAVQVVKTDHDDGAYWVIVAGHLLGTVQPHRTVTGGRSGWEARHRSGTTAWHLGKGAGGGTRPATRDKAVIDLIADAHHAWRNHRELAKRDAARRRLEANRPESN